LYNWWISQLPPLVDDDNASLLDGREMSVRVMQAEQELTTRIE